MVVRVRRFSRWAALGSAGLLVQDKFHGLALGDWGVVAWIALGLSVAIVLLTEDALRRRRPTIHLGRHEGRPAVWIVPPERPLSTKAGREEPRYRTWSARNTRGESRARGTS